MKRTATRIATVLTLIGATVLGSRAHAGDVPVELSALPAPVTTTLAQRWPEGHAIKAARDEGELEVVLDVAGHKIEVMLKDDGTFLETEESVEIAALPEAVRKAGEALGVVTRGEKRTTADGVVDFELVVKEKGKSSEVRFDADGRTLKSEDDEDGPEEK